MSDVWRYVGAVNEACFTATDSDSEVRGVFKVGQRTLFQPGDESCRGLTVSLSFHPPLTSSDVKQAPTS